MNDYVAKPTDGAAWVTGASSGIGRAVALRLAGAGFVVYATARNKDKLADLARDGEGLSGRIVAAPADVTDAGEMERVAGRIVAEEGAIALALFNAGVFLPVHAETFDREAFAKTFAVNLEGVVNGLAPAIQAMRPAGRGQIVLVSSVTGYGGLPTSGAYGASKAALINMAESLKFDLDKLGIRIQVVNPGFVDTPATQKNPFAMPALQPVERAAERIVAGIEGSRFEITFPRRFTYLLKALQLLPYPAYFWLVSRATGWHKRPPERAPSSQATPSTGHAGSSGAGSAGESATDGRTDRHAAE